MLNVENGFVIVMGHSRSLEIAPFDRVHLLAFLVTMSLSCTVSDFLGYSKILIEKH